MRSLILIATAITLSATAAFAADEPISPIQPAKVANPGEMASTHTLALSVLQSIPAYVAEYKKVSGGDGHPVRWRAKW